MTLKKIARGIRNNNPGNIRKSSNKWLGKIQGVDKDFETFDTPENGIRAVAVLLLTYRDKGLVTPVQIVSRYAPSNENNTVAYAAKLAAKIGVGINDSTVPVPLEKIVRAVISIENGVVPYTYSEIKTAVSKA